MFVSEILASKGSAVMTVAPHDSAAHAVDVMASRRIGAVLVLDVDGSVQGILSERDVVRALSMHGALALTLRVEALMTSDVIVCDPDDTIDQVMALMTTGRFRHVPVVRRGELRGLVSIGDVVKWRLEEVRHESEALRQYIVVGA
jgi:CBS domain-containing protein